MKIPKGKTDLVIKYLPNYEERYEEWAKNNKGCAHEAFIREYFEEAIINFAEKYRLKCQDKLIYPKTM